MTDRRDWHPILAAVEGPPGTWRMIDPRGFDYGLIEIRRVNGGAEVRYKAQHRGEVIGWSNSLRLACERVHQAYLRAMGPGLRSGAPDAIEIAERAARAAARP